MRDKIFFSLMYPIVVLIIFGNNIDGILVGNILHDSLTIAFLFFTALLYYGFIWLDNGNLSRS